MRCESDKHSILFRVETGSEFFQLFRFPSGVIRTGGYGNLDLDAADSQKLLEWLTVAVEPRPAKGVA